MTPTLTTPGNGSSLRNVRTQPLLIGAFLVTCAFMVVVGGIGIWGMSQMAGQTTQITDRNLPGVRALTQTRADIYKTGRDFRQAALDADSTATAADMKLVETDKQQLTSDFATYQALAHSAQQQQGVSDFQTSLTGWLTTLSDLTPLVSSTTSNANAQLANLLRTKLIPQGDALSRDLNTLVTLDQQSADAARADALNTFARLRWTLAIVLVLASGLAILLGFVIARQFARPLSELSAIANRVADGEQFTIDDVVARYGGQSEMGQVTLAFQRFLTNLGELVTSANHLAEGELHPIDAIEARYANDAQKGILAKSLNTIIHRQQEYSELAHRIGDGEVPDLAYISARYEGKPKSTGELAKSLVKMTDNLRELVASAELLAHGELSPIDAIEARYASDPQKGILAKSLNKIVHRQIEYAEIAQRVGDGDLARIDYMMSRYEGNPKAGIMAKALNVMIENLRTLVGHVHEMSAGVATASHQIVEAAEQSGHATEQVAQTIQQVATGAQSQSAQLAEAAQEIEQLAQQSTALQTESLETMQTMDALKGSVSLTSERIRQLGKRSQEIGQIIQTIDELAGQTNLLALNAAIEAARAGEHGRGFAVVADEVRKLAERSASATKEIEEIIRETQRETTLAVEAMELGVTQVEEGVARVARTEAQAQEMVQSTEHISQAINVVASVGEENSAAAEEVSAATEEMAAQVEETVAATQTLSELASSLSQAVDVFQLEDATGAPPRGGIHAQKGQSTQRRRHAA